MSNPLSFIFQFVGEIRYKHFSPKGSQSYDIWLVKRTVWCVYVYVCVCVLVKRMDYMNYKNKKEREGESVCMRVCVHPYLFTYDLFHKDLLKVMKIELSFDVLFHVQIIPILSW
jgi:hypothetical protein